MVRVKRGMLLEEVREIWRLRADTKTKAIMEKYYSLPGRGAGAGSEGLGVYSIYKERAARDKVRLAACLLEKAGLPVSYSSIRKVTGQSDSTIRHYWSPPQEIPPEAQAMDGAHEQTHIIRFPRQLSL